MADGKGCKCAAHSESECGCDADWTPQEVYDLRSEAELLRVRITVLETAIRRMAEQDATLSACDGNVTVTIDATLTDEERQAIERAAAWMARVAESRGDIHSAWYLVSDAATLRGLLERTK
jgi:hypothetical protein